MQALSAQKAHQTHPHQEKKALALALNPTHAPHPIQAPEWCPILGLIAAPEWCLGEKIVAPHLKHDYNSVCTVQQEEPEHKPATSKLSRLFRWLFTMQNDDTQHTKDEL
uniref:Uncharacterized protein n=1 Tax=Salix viminalis TaxID=40686 RepID=A0A6N2KW43_SALVM